MDNKEKIFLSIKNFKCLEDVGEIELKPLTFLFGKNGSGKSSFIKAIRFLSHNLFSIYDELHHGGSDIDKFYYNIDDLNLGSYDEIVTNNDTSKNIEFEIRMENALIRINELLKYYGSKKETSIDDSFYSILSDENKFEIVKDQKKEDEFWDSLNAIDWSTQQVNQTVLIDCSVIVEFGYKQQIKISISDKTNNFVYTFIPNTTSPENYHYYQRDIVIKGDKNKELFLNDLFKFERTIPFADCLEDNYQIRVASRKKILQNYKENVLKHLYDYQNSEPWINLTPEQKRNYYFDLLKEFLIIFILIPEKVETYFREVIHLPSIRELPKPFYQLTEGRFNTKDYFGLLREFDSDDNLGGLPVPAKYLDIEKMLYLEYEIDNIPIGSLSEFINYFLKRLKLADGLESRKDKDKKFGGSLVFKAFDNSAVSNLTHASSGLIQVLPIISTSFYVRGKENVNYKFIRIIEQPELHLHPKLQCDLAEFFCHKILEERNFIIETHSEHIIRKMQVLIARKDKKLGHDNLRHRVAVYYFDKDNKDGITSIKKMEHDEKGRFLDDWPAGFFDTDTEIALEFFREISKN